MALKDRGKDTCVQADEKAECHLVLPQLERTSGYSYFLLLWEYLQMFQVLNKNAPNIAFWIATDVSVQVALQVRDFLLMRFAFTMKSWRRGEGSFSENH